MEYALVFEPGEPIQFRALNEEAEKFCHSSPVFHKIVGATWWAHREEPLSACTIVAVAKDLEEQLRVVTRRDITVKPVRPLIREVGRTKDPVTGDVTCRMEGVLCDLRG